MGGLINARLPQFKSSMAFKAPSLASISLGASQTALSPLRTSVRGKHASTGATVFAFYMLVSGCS